MRFNPPFNLKTRTKISKSFLNLLDRDFPPHNQLYRLFNRTNVKISYSCIPNMNSYTYMHNQKVLNDKANETGINNCNCRNKDTCLLPNSCQTKFLIYQVNIDCDIAGYKQNVTLAHVKQHLKIVSGIIKRHSTTLNIKMKRTFKTIFGNQKAQWNTKNYMEDYQNM